MRVSIEHGQKTTGLFSRTTWYTIKTVVQFTPEEKDVIKRAKLKDSVLLERVNERQAKGLSNAEFETLKHHYYLRVRDLIAGDVFEVATPVEAKAYEEELKEALNNLKAHLEANETAPSGRQTFDL
jgi:hypothetical protein